MLLLCYVSALCMFPTLDRQSLSNITLEICLCISISWLHTSCGQRVCLIDPSILSNQILCLFMLSHSVKSDSLLLHGLKPARVLCPQDFSWQEYWTRLPFPPPEDLPDPGIQSSSPALAGGLFYHWTT